MIEKLDFAQLKSSGNLPSPQGIALTVMELCRQENVPLSEIANVIRGDPALAGRVIKVANAINLNKRRPIASVSPETLIIIGTNTVQQIVLGFSLINNESKAKCAKFDYPYFWSRSVAIAAAAQAIGATTRLAPAAEMFTCGLLSGVGLIGLASVKPDSYSEVLEQTDGLGMDALRQAEKDRFGLHHCELSHLMMSDWGLPRFYTEAVLFHEDPSSGTFAPGSRQAKLTWSIHLASLIADACMATDEQAQDALMERICEGGEHLELDMVEMISIADETAREWHEWGSILNIETRLIRPFKPPSGNAERKDTLRVGANLPPMRILVVDDEMISFIFSRMLGASGHTVFTAAEGREALEIALREKPHVVISDWMSPELDGATLCRTLRDTNEGKHIHFVMLSEETDDPRKSEALRAGADAYLAKPFDPGQIHEELHRAHKKRQ